MNRNLVGCINESLLISSRSVNKHGHHKQFLFLVGQLIKICSESAWLNEAKFSRRVLWRLLISFWSVYKHSRHRQFLFLVVDFYISSPKRRNFTGMVYGRSSFHPKRTKNIAAMGNSFFWLAVKPIKIGGTMNCYFVKMVYGKSCTKFSYFVLCN